MTRRAVRLLPVWLGLASLVGASLACGGPRRGPGEELPSPAAEITEAVVTAAPVTVAPQPTATQPPEATPGATLAPTDTALPVLTATTAAGVTATSPPDGLGEQVESLLDQFDQDNVTAEAELGEITVGP